MSSIKEVITEQARYITRKWPGEGGRLITDSGGESQELQEAVLKGVRLGQKDCVNDALDEEHRKIIKRISG